MELFYRPKNAVLGDVIPFYDDGKFKPFYLKNRRDYRGAEVKNGWHMLTTEDHINFTEHFTGISGGTGSVLKVDGLYYLFYCTFESNPKKQYVRLATSPDLDAWTVRDEVNFSADDVVYDYAEWRDPHVFWNGEANEWWMLVASAIKGKTARRACVGLCTSKDLWHWEYKEPFYAPMAAGGACECPDIFKIGDWWYLTYSNYCDRFTGMYRMSKSLNGPWIRPERDTFDSRAYYAPKTGTDGKRRYIYGWNPTKEANPKKFDHDYPISRDTCTWDWGGTLVVHEIIQNQDGTLRVIPEEHVNNALKTKEPLIMEPIIGKWATKADSASVVADRGFAGLLLNQVPGMCKLELDVTFAPGTRRFGVALQLDENMDMGYYLYLEPGRNRIEYVSGIRFYGDGGKMFPYAVEMERPFSLEPDTKYNMKIFVQDTVLVVYLNDEVAMNARMYDYKNRRFGLFCADGEARFEHIALYTE